MVDKSAGYSLPTMEDLQQRMGVAQPQSQGLLSQAANVGSGLLSGAGQIGSGLLGGVGQFAGDVGRAVAPVAPQIAQNIADIYMQTEMQRASQPQLALDPAELRPISPLAAAGQVMERRRKMAAIEELAKKEAESKLLAQQQKGKQEGFKQEQGLRKEYDTMSKGYRSALEGYGKVRASALAKNPTGADDVALVFGFMKTIDPTSVVREGEFATAEQTGGVPDRVRVFYNKLINGQRLTPTQRSYFLNAATRQFASIRPQQIDLERRYGSLASSYGLDEENIVETYSDKFSDAFGPDSFSGALVEPDALRMANFELGTKENPRPIQRIEDAENYPEGTIVQLRVDGKLQTIEVTRD